MDGTATPRADVAVGLLAGRVGAAAFHWPLWKKKDVNETESDLPRTPVVKSLAAEGGLGFAIHLAQT